MAKIATNYGHSSTTDGFAGKSIQKNHKVKQTFKLNKRLINF